MSGSLDAPRCFLLNLARGGLLAAVSCVPDLVRRRKLNEPRRRYDVDSPGESDRGGKRVSGGGDLPWAELFGMDGEKPMIVSLIDSGPIRGPREVASVTFSRRCGMLLIFGEKSGLTIKCPLRTLVNDTNLCKSRLGSTTCAKSILTLDGGHAILIRAPSAYPPLPWISSAMYFAYDKSLKWDAMVKLKGLMDLWFGAWITVVRIISFAINFGNFLPRREA